MPVSGSCILCGAKTEELAAKCQDCDSLAELVEALYIDSKDQLSTNPSVEREAVFKTLREFAFVVQEDALLRTYKNSIKFFLSQFIDKEVSETPLELFTKKVQTRLNPLKILRELSDSEIISWDARSISTQEVPMIYSGSVMNNLKTSYFRSTVKDRTDQRFGHAIAYYSILPLLIEYGSCNSKEETRRLNVVPKKPWIIMLSILIGNVDGKMSLERTSNFLKKRRGIGNVYGTIITNLSSLSTDYSQKATVDREESDDKDRAYVLSNDIVKYLERVRENIRTRD